LYRDPIHDFGFFKFDPSKLRYFKPEEIELAPEKAKVGTEIRVVGNDANEKLSIAQGTLARLDRPAPSYDVGSYNDFNTFYMQAASSTSGGSSGSPVLAIDGKAVALNAGASRVSSQSYYLPLDRIVRALNLIKQGNPDRAVTEFKGVEQNEPVCVPRGTILAEFKFIAIDEAKRLGLSFEHEKLIRTAKLVKMGVLVLNKVVQGGPSDGKLENGDIVVLVEDKLVNEFVGIESALDDNIGKKIKVILIVCSADSG
jgi:S1-C subfamily serine protease